jgi:HPt (histidine-containing phosphotransfer) domain-containing protein
MIASTTPPSASIDKNNLLRLLNGNIEMMDTVLREIFQKIPAILKEINSSIKNNDYLGVITYAPRVKSAFSMLGEPQLALTFQAIEDYARMGEMSEVKYHFETVFHETMVKINLIQEVA